MGFGKGTEPCNGSKPCGHELRDHDKKGSCRICKQKCKA